MKMNLWKICAGVFCASLVIATSADARIKEGKNGVFTERVYTSAFQADITYEVDSEARLCFATLSGSGSLLIPCENLARRSGWREIITWIKDSPVEPAQ